jgi:hypothetical protein
MLITPFSFYNTPATFSFYNTPATFSFYNTPAIFSFYNTPATFQNYINYILHNALNNYYIVYLNNILIFLKTRAKYIKYINKII